MHEWLEAARERIAAESGLDSGELALAEPEIAVLLDLARVAAHSSGDRTNAPLVCFLLGRAMGCGPDVDLAELARAASSPGET
ncbi:MAG TPA: DUF6457 domain-containing protein [Gaiellaceae bacterium]|nr:DUF6457 domain-containing protein [Gaiellaceae bacterium]